MSNRQIPEEEVEINMTPMLDIVFIMLIFFIVTAVFVKEAGVDVRRPEAETANEVKRVSILIAVTADNEVWINKRKVQPQEIRAIVAKLKQENPKGNVVITADENSQSQALVSVVEQLNQVGVAGVSIATNKGG